MTIPAISLPPATPPFTIEDVVIGDNDVDGHFEHKLTVTNNRSGKTMEIVYDDHDDSGDLSPDNDIVSVKNPSGMTLPF